MSDILIIPGGSQPLRPYIKPRINGVVIVTGGGDVIVTGGGDVLEEYTKQRSEEIAGALRSIETPDLSMTQLYLHVPEPPEIHYLPPLGGYPDGRENRRERRRRERERAKKKRR